MVMISAVGIVTAVLLAAGLRARSSPPSLSSGKAEPLPAYGACPVVSRAMLCAGEPYFEAIAGALRDTGFVES